MVSMTFLRNMAFAGGFITLGGGLYFKRRIQAQFRESEYYTKSVNLLLGYPPGLDILGKPIKVRNVDIGNHKLNWVDGFKARVGIPLDGVKESGTLHSWASREKPSDSWEVDKLDLETKGRQWTFYINPKSRDKFKPTQSMGSDNEQLETERSDDNANNQTALQSSEEQLTTDLTLKDGEQLSEWKRS